MVTVVDNAPGKSYKDAEEWRGRGGELRLFGRHILLSASSPQVTHRLRSCHTQVFLYCHIPERQSGESFWLCCNKACCTQILKFWLRSDFSLVYMGIDLLLTIGTQSMASVFGSKSCHVLFGVWPSQSRDEWEA